MVYSSVRRSAGSGREATRYRNPGAWTNERDKTSGERYLADGSIACIRRTPGEEAHDTAEEGH